MDVVIRSINSGYTFSWSIFNVSLEAQHLLQECMAGQRFVRLFKMGLNYNLITLTVNSLGLFQENLTLKTDVYLSYNHLVLKRMVEIKTQTLLFIHMIFITFIKIRFFTRIPGPSLKTCQWEKEGVLKTLVFQNSIIEQLLDAKYIFKSSVRKY